MLTTVNNNGLLLQFELHLSGLQLLLTQRQLKHLHSNKLQRKVCTTNAKTIIEIAGVLLFCKQ